jgi:hypothetical protein
MPSNNSKDTNLKHFFDRTPKGHVLLPINRIEEMLVKASRAGSLRRSSKSARRKLLIEGLATKSHAIIDEPEQKNNDATHRNTMRHTNVSTLKILSRLCDSTPTSCYYCPTQF